MKTRYPIIALIAIIIIRTILDEMYPLYGPPAIVSSLCEIATVVFLVLTIYTLIANRKKKTAERQREVERKEIDMVRKSNDILIHLIQDEHREEDR